MIKNSSIASNNSYFKDRTKKDSQKLTLGLEDEHVK